MKPKKEKVGHSMAITALLPLPKLQFLASASLDKKIILWDLLDNSVKREYKGKHKKGIMVLDFSEALILLISGGFDHEIYVWNPYIDAPVHNLSGHVSPIIGLAFVQNPLHIISIDQDCIMKVWDTKKFKCVDTPTLEDMEDRNSFKVNGVCLLNSPTKVVLFGKNIYTFGYDKNNSLTSADENVSLCARFVANSLCLMTPVGNKVKLWNLLTGEIKKIFSDLTKSDISSLVLDSKGKRFIMGDTEGNVGVYNVTNGALLKTLSKHKGEIIFLIHAVNSQSAQNALNPQNPVAVEYFISASVDNNIKIHDDKELGESKLVSKFQLKDANITALIYERSVGKLLVGASNGVITFYETSTGKGNEEFFDTDIHSGPESEITCLAFFTGEDTFAYANSVGKIKFVVMPKLQIKHEVIFRMTNLAPDGLSPSIVNNMVYCQETSRLFYTDDRFYIKCMDVSQVLAHIEVVKCQKDKAKRVFIITPEMVATVWKKRVHEESIRSLEYIPEEKLLVTTSMDKNVKIFYSESGEHIESLRQNKSGNKIKPIAYKKVESNEIYSPRMEHRVDAPYVAAKEYRDKKLEEYLKDLDNGLNPTYRVPDEIIINDAEDVEEAFKEYESQEFDPFFYTNASKSKINMKWLDRKRSNDWALRIKFQKYFEMFESEIDETSHKVQDLEDELLKQKEAEEKNMGTKSEDAKDQIHQKAKAATASFKNKFISQTGQEAAKMKQRMNAQEKKNKKKSSVKKCENLYKSGLKSMIVKNLVNDEKKVKLSQSECDALERFARAFSALDEDEPRVLRFTDFELRKGGQDKAKLSEKSESHQASKISLDGNKRTPLPKLTEASSKTIKTRFTKS